MRKTYQPQLQIGQITIASLQLDTRSRDDIPKILRGLQFIYTTPAVRDEVFSILEAMAGAEADLRNGRPGMKLWEILVLGSLRLGLNCDYDRLQELAGKHQDVLVMLGHGPFDVVAPYKLQTLRDNLRLFTPEVLEQINAVAVRAGHELVKKNGTELKGRCDSFVVETDVHYPTDGGLLWDAVRKALELAAAAAAGLNVAGWRKVRHILRRVKKAWRQLQQARRDPARQVQAAAAYAELSAQQLARVRRDLPLLAKAGLAAGAQEEIRRFVRYGELFADQLGRRVVKGETIPQEEKIFSIFEPHTEWISKGKAGVPAELGLKVCILEDQYGFILHQRVMVREMDQAAAVPMVDGARRHFPELAACSFDKGFHSPANQRDLAQRLRKVVLPKKGKRNGAEMERERESEFVRLRRKHSAVESGINALEAHGLDRCPDRGLAGFRRYVALAVLARNIQQLGAILLKQEQRRAKRQVKRQARLRQTA